MKFCSVKYVLALYFGLCRLLGNVGKHPRVFAKLVIHLIGVYCAETQNGTLYPEAKARMLFECNRKFIFYDIIVLKHFNPFTDETNCFVVY